MTSLPDRSTFETAYTGQAPWDIGRPQQAFLISVFPGYVKRIYDLIAWLQSKGPGGLT